MVYNSLRRLAVWLLPQICPLCGDSAAEGEFCNGCERALPLLGPHCTRCALPFDSSALDGAICGQCQQDPPSYTLARAPFRYARPIDRLIIGAKHGRLDWAALLGRRLAHAMREHAASIDALVPMPLHRARLRERGYNQSLEIARVAGKILQLPVRLDVERLRATPSQAALTRDERLRNVRDAFRAAECVAGRRIALIDDVMTSGATAEMAARSLSKAGATKVEIWVVGRA